MTLKLRARQTPQAPGRLQARQTHCSRLDGLLRPIFHFCRHAKTFGIDFDRARNTISLFRPHTRSLGNAPYLQLWGILLPPLRAMPSELRGILPPPLRAMPSELRGILPPPSELSPQSYGGFCPHPSELCPQSYALRAMGDFAPTPQSYALRAMGSELCPQS